MYLYDVIVIIDMCPTKRYNTNSDDHERRGQKEVEENVHIMCVERFEIVGI